MVQGNEDSWSTQVAYDVWKISIFMLLILNKSFRALRCNKTRTIEYSLLICIKNFQLTDLTRCHSTGYIRDTHCFQWLKHCLSWTPSLGL